MPFKSGDIPWNKGLKGWRLGEKRPSISNEKHPKWKGDDVGYRVAHKYIRVHNPKPKLCEICNMKPSYDLAFKYAIGYSRNPSDYMWLCRSCHESRDKHELRELSDT